MCGIFGVTSKKSLNFDDFLKFYITGRRSMSRGYDASGFLVFNDNEIILKKSNKKFTKLYGIYNTFVSSFKFRNFNSIVGHTRLATHGDSNSDLNNHPIVSNNWKIIHNGWITNYEDFFYNDNYIQLNDKNDRPTVDTFAINLVLEQIPNNFSDINEISVAKQLSKLKGEFSIFALHKSGFSFLYSNVGNLYILKNSKKLFFASEPHFIPSRNRSQVKKIKLNTVYKIADFGEFNLRITNESKKIKLSSYYSSKDSKNSISELIHAFNEKIHQLDDKRKKLNRCSICLIPETFPHIEFNSFNECNFCINFIPKNESSLDLSNSNSKIFLSSLLNKGLNKNKDVIVGLSGGRDSCYLLHIMRELGFNPIAFTYDWGLISNSARENMAKLTGELGIEHVLVARKTSKVKRKIKKTVRILLKDPLVDVIPLLMAGDKSWMSVARRTSKKRGNIPVLMGIHRIENTMFKTASLIKSGKIKIGQELLPSDVSKVLLLKLMFRYFYYFLKHPSLAIVMSLESLVGFVNYYFRSKNILTPLNLIKYNPDEIEKILKTKYGYSFKKLKNESTWRAGDMTSHFYDILYFNKFLFTEQDLIISNLVREGILNIDEGRKKIDKLDRFNPELLKDYCNYLELDFAFVLDKLNELKS